MTRPSTSVARHVNATAGEALDQHDKTAAPTRPTPLAQSWREGNL